MSYLISHACLKTESPALLVILLSEQEVSSISHVYGQSILMVFHSIGCWLLFKFICNYAYSNTILWLVFVTDCELHALQVACLWSHCWFCLTGDPGHLIACKLPNIEYTRIPLTILIIGWFAILDSGWGSCMKWTCNVFNNSELLLLLGSELPVLKYSF